MFSKGKAKTKDKFLTCFQNMSKITFSRFLQFSILHHKSNTQGNTRGFTLKTSFGNEILIEKCSNEFLQVSLVATHTQ